MVEDIAAGDTFSAQNMRCIRPGFGLHTKFYEDILGKTAEQDIARGMPLKQAMVSGLKP